MQLLLRLGLPAACLLACTEAQPALEPCPPRDAAAAPDIDGVYRYRSPIFALRGTITFARQGDRVSVLDTTYDNAADRALIGQAPLQGNFAAFTLAPSNGDTDYQAEVDFVFEDGAFCVTRFSDSNDDVGAEGSYRGTRIGRVPDAAVTDAR
jgi:hypothetical protein